MPYSAQPDRIPTALEVLNHQTVEQLKALASLQVVGSIPARKAELINYVWQQMQGGALQRLRKQCDRLQQAVISEVVHSADDRYQPARFISKYGQEPVWDTGEHYSYNYKPSILGWFFSTLAKLTRVAEIQD